ncbi:ethanolaminephosphotransferase 1-like isoform X1 [Polypterus senegalus]|uniref:ethanolaminephosphotransferase 1-like isoform X1 n=1 Tax=Polypterus senegalus TaxID=55291 RepID=UPI001964B0EA|nr:ethanolaminephosphotransferase 1-like isoform X1 [Polypterus senegalus]
MFGYRYVTRQQLAGFDQYKYNAVDTNPLSVYVMQNLWNRIVKAVPLWIAPNLLTFTGFLLILLNYFLLAYYDWNYTSSSLGSRHAPKWVWGLTGLTTFSAYALDSVDGKHARRTHSSSPLGELFDHGLDSWATSLFTLSFFSVFGLSAEREVTPFTLYYILCIILFTFMLSHWEKYNTGVLFLPWGYDISQVTLTSVYLLTAIYGVEAWHKPLMFGYLFADILIAMVIGCSVFLSLPQTLYNIYQAKKLGTLQRNSISEGLLPLLSPTLLFLLLTTWAKISPEDILTKNPRIFLWMVGVTFSNVTCRLIVCQMTKTRSEVIHWLLIPLAGTVGAVYMGLEVHSEFALLTGYTLLVTVAHVHYGICVGKQLSAYFNIFIFSLEKRRLD